MRTIYFDDLFLIIHNDGYSLCEHFPYEQPEVLLTVDLNQEYITPEHLIYSLTQSEDFVKLRIKVIGIPHKLSNAQ